MLLFVTTTCILQTLKSWLPTPPTLTKPPADINMRLLSASRCAGRTCRLSHVILQERTLILLHCPSTVNSCTKSTSFHSILSEQRRTGGLLWFQPEEREKKMLPEARKRKSLRWGNGSDPYHNFPSSSARWCAVIYGSLSLSPTLPPPPSLPPQTNSWSALVFSHVTCRTHWCDSALTYYSKQTCKPTGRLIIHSSFSSTLPSVRISILLFLLTPLIISPFLSLHPCLDLLISIHLNPHVCLHTHSFFSLSLHPLSSLCSCVFAAATSPSSPPAPPSLSFLIHFLSGREITAARSGGALAALRQPLPPAPDVS